MVLNTLPLFIRLHKPCLPVTWTDKRDKAKVIPRTIDVKSGPNQDQPRSDGIGDTPYVIDENNQDRYPLMNPYVLLGDVNSDGVVDIRDIAIFGKAFGSYSGHPRWNPAADLDGNGIINILDGVIIAKNFGKKL
jgi:hypothetical protein